MEASKALNFPSQNTQTPRTQMKTDRNEQDKHIMSLLKSTVLANLAALNPSKIITPHVNSHIEQQLQQFFPSFHIPSHPPYASMIERAIMELNEEKGSTEEAISEFIKREYSDLPFGHKSFLSHHLRKLCKSGDLYCTNRERYILMVGSGDLGNMRGLRGKSCKEELNEMRGEEVLFEKELNDEQNKMAKRQRVEALEEPNHTGKQHLQVTESKIEAAAQQHEDGEWERERTEEESETGRQRSEVIEELSEGEEQQIEATKKHIEAKRQRVEALEETNRLGNQHLAVTELKIEAAAQLHEDGEWEQERTEEESQRQGRQSEVMEELNEAERQKNNATEKQIEVEISDRSTLEFNKAESNRAEAEENEVIKDLVQVEACCNEVQEMQFKSHDEAHALSMCTEFAKKTKGFEERLLEFSVSFGGMKVSKSNNCRSMMDVNEDCFKQEQCKLIIKSPSGERGYTEEMMEEQQQCQEWENKETGQQSKCQEQQIDVRTKTLVHHDSGSVAGIGLRVPCGKFSLPVIQEAKQESLNQEKSFRRRSPGESCKAFIVCGVLAAQKPQPKIYGQLRATNSQLQKMPLSNESHAEADRQLKPNIIERPQKSKTNGDATISALFSVDPQHYRDMWQQKRRGQGRPHKLNPNANTISEGMLPSDDQQHNEEHHQPECPCSGWFPRSISVANSTAVASSCSDLYNHVQQQPRCQDPCRPCKVKDATAKTLDTQSNTWEKPLSQFCLGRTQKVKNATATTADAQSNTEQDAAATTTKNKNKNNNKSIKTNGEPLIKFRCRNFCGGLTESIH